MSLVLSCRFLAARYRGMKSVSILTPRAPSLRGVRGIYIENSIFGRADVAHGRACKYFRSLSSCCSDVFFPPRRFGVRARNWSRTFQHFSRASFRSDQIVVAEIIVPFIHDSRKCAVAHTIQIIIIENLNAYFFYSFCSFLPFFFCINQRNGMSSPVRRNFNADSFESLSETSRRVLSCLSKKLKCNPHTSDTWTIKCKYMRSDNFWILLPRSFLQTGDAL